MQNLTLAKKLMVMLLLPVMVLLGYALTKAYTAFSLRQDTSQLQELSQLTVHASNFVHNTQSERGATAIYLSSKGTKYASELKAQRLKTDEKRTVLLTFLKEFDVEDISSDLDSNLQKAIATVNKLDSSRSAIDSLEMSLSDALKYYSGNNTAWLGIASMMSTISTNAELAVMSTAYVNYLQNKERAGIERAVLAGTFTRDSFGTSFNKFLSLVSAQENYTNVFLS
ncbi:MAG: methyl-accepting chemotaxis protein, partial [Gammaproteobacteria bacterium]|nr:methyl-accepting chemotaxis protein [Gammaproteobacteria bacterium]